VQLFIPHDGAPAMVGVVGALQLDVLAERLQAEYGLPVSFENSRFEICRWISSDQPAELEKFVRAYPSAMADDLDGAPVFLAQSAFNLRYDQERWPAIQFTDIKDYQVGQG
jgi:peptide chain release factor 3